MRYESLRTKRPRFGKKNYGRGVRELSSSNKGRTDLRSSTSARAVSLTHLDTPLQHNTQWPHFCFLYRPPSESSRNGSDLVWQLPSLLGLSQMEANNAIEILKDSKRVEKSHVSLGEAEKLRRTRMI